MLLALRSLYESSGPITGTSVKALALAGAIVGAHGTAGTSAAAIAFSGSTGGAHGMAGSSSAAFTFGRTTTGGHGVAGSSSASMQVQGSASGAHGAGGTTTAAFLLGGQAEGTFGSTSTFDPAHLLRLTSRSWALALDARTYSVPLPPPVYEVPAMASPINFSPKDPDEILDLGLGFTGLLASGETIQSATATVEDANGQAQASMVQGAPDITKAPWVFQRVKGGTAGSTYLLRIKATTSSGLIKVGAKPFQIRRGA